MSDTFHPIHCEVPTEDVPGLTWQGEVLRTLLCTRLVDSTQPGQVRYAAVRVYGAAGVKVLTDEVQRQLDAGRRVVITDLTIHPDEGPTP